jgi:hypothetical protein
MKQGYLSEYFTGVASKRLSAVEADVLASHQHEINGVEALKRVFGQATGKQHFPARFVYLRDWQDEPVVADGSLTWYDAREKHPTRSEHRLYFPPNAVADRAAAGDQLIIGRRPDGSVLVIVADDGSTVAAQLRWLFGVADLVDAGYAVRDSLDSERDRLALASRIVLENIGVEVAAPPDSHLEEMLRKFDGRFPVTRDFSSYARSTLPSVRPQDGADAALVAWMEREEALFRTLERHLIADRLAEGFDDVDAFIVFSLSVQNRRKSRVGYALENHLESLLTATGIRFARTSVTENRSKPDFLFPGATEYRDPKFDLHRLTALGVKSTCKDRWRQVLSEADRVERKHLLTLEPAISTNQTDEMQARQLQLVLPRSLHATYTSAQQTWLMDVSGFVALVRERQAVLTRPAAS